MGNESSSEGELRALMIRDPRFAELRKRAMRVDTTFYVKVNGDIEIYDAKKTEVENEFVKGPKSEDDINVIIEKLANIIKVKADSRGYHHFGYQ